MTATKRKTATLEKLQSAKTGKGLIKLIKNLAQKRRENKIKDKKRHQLTKKQRDIVLSKTDGRCHLCGIELDGKDFQADHVKSYSSGGVHNENNYLPSCSTCNNYRWHYSPEEIQVILKMGVWVKTKVINDPSLGLAIANAFIKYEMGVRRRRKLKH
jgi:hypothetical protein